MWLSIFWIGGRCLCGLVTTNEKWELFHFDEFDFGDLLGRTKTAMEIEVCGLMKYAVQVDPLIN